MSDTHLVPQDVDEQCRELFNQLTMSMSNEDRWRAAEEVTASMAGILMERDELEE